MGWTKAFGAVLCLLALLIGQGAWAADARVEAARQAAWSGNIEAARQQWEDLLEEAGRTRDAALAEAARSGLAALAFQVGDYARFESIQHQRLNDAQRRQDRVQAADAHMELALLERRRGHLQRARDGLEQAIEVFREADDRSGEAQASIQLSLVLLNQGRFVEALALLDRVLAWHRAGVELEIDRAYHYLGLLHHRLEDFNEARLWLDRGLVVARAQPDPMRAGALLGSLARVANDQGEHERAMQFALEAHALAERFDSTPGQIYSDLETGRALLGLDRLDEAERVLDLALTLSRSIAQERTAADAIFVLGRVAQRRGDSATALAHYRQALANYETARDTPQTMDAYRRMIPLLLELDHHEEAGRLAVRALALQEQLSGHVMSRRIALLQYRHEVEDNARQIESLARENEIQQLRLERQAQARLYAGALILGLATLTLGLAGGIIHSRRIRRKLEASNAELVRNRRELARTHAELKRHAVALGKAARTDALTDLANRRHVRERLDQELGRVAAAEQSLSILLIDIDHFKQVNDRHGHNAGDRVLEQLGQRLKALVPPQALAARHGGEEFLVVLPGQERAAAVQLAEDIRSDVAAMRAPGVPPVTLSIGVATCPPGSVTGSAQLIELADQGLYRAKADGRDRVVFVSQDRAGRPVPES